MPSRSLGDKDSISSVFLGVCGAYVLTAILSISFTTPASALQSVPGSPCADACSGVTYANNTVCLDDEYLNGGKGTQFRECTTCLLNSTAIDSSANVSDVYWGLFNLRYTLSECMFAYPAEIVSISSPCQVTCQPLQPAVSYEIGSDLETATDNVVPNFDYCNQNFGDNKINNCSFCYTYIPQQLFLGNFMQALHIACRQPPAIGDTFYPDGRAIFNESAIPGPSPPSTKNTGNTGLTGWKLGLAIALPIVGGVLLFGLGCFCCFKFTKTRRQRMAASGRMSTFHERHPAGSDYTSPVSGRTPPSKYEWPEPAQEMERVSVVHTPKSADRQRYSPGFAPGVQKYSPGLAQGRWRNSHREDEEDDVPLSAAPRDDVGPGPSQVKDPYLHEQFFGVASSGVPGEDVAGPSFAAPSVYIHPPPPGRRSWGQGNGV